MLRVFHDKIFISHGPEKGAVIDSFSLNIWNISTGKVENDISKRSEDASAVFLISAL